MADALVLAPTWTVWKGGKGFQPWVVWSRPSQLSPLHGVSPTTAQQKSGWDQSKVAEPDTGNLHSGKYVPLQRNVGAWIFSLGCCWLRTVLHQSSEDVKKVWAWIRIQPSSCSFLWNSLTVCIPINHFRCILFLNMKHLSAAATIDDLLKIMLSSNISFIMWQYSISLF